MKEATTIDIKIKRLAPGSMRKYTKTEMRIILQNKHPELLDDLLYSSLLVNDEQHAASILTDILIEECLDIDTLESDEERRKRIPPEPPLDDLWDRLSETIQ